MTASYAWRWRICVCRSLERLKGDLMGPESLQRAANATTGVEFSIVVRARSNLDQDRTNDRPALAQRPGDRQPGRQRRARRDDHVRQRVYLEDLGSTNGTTVNGQPIKKHLLQHADMVEIGKYRIRFLVNGGGEVAPTSTSTPRSRCVASSTVRGPRRSRSARMAPRWRRRQQQGTAMVKILSAPTPAGSSHW